MASNPQFLANLEQLRRTYNPAHNRPIADIIEGMDANFKELSKQVERGPIGALIMVKFHLREIAALSLDGLRAGDYEKIFKEIVDLQSKKNAGYAGIGATDPWANFRMSEMFGVSAFIGCLIRITDKYIRIVNLNKNPNADQVGEAITDTFFDLAIYCLIAICLFEEEYKVLCDGGMQP